MSQERVIDYNARERREVRMDLFAREFLLPRAWARKLYLDDGVSRQAIASRLTAPLSLVTQQLLDALLLPTTESTDDAPAKAAPDPDPTQQVAIDHRGSALQLQAGPGTGKTQTLVNHVDALIREGVAPDSILVLTFSNKAAGELVERLAARHPTAAASVWVGTFHSFGLDIVRRFHEALGLPASPRLIDRNGSIELLEDKLALLPLKHYVNLYNPTLALDDILDAISRAKDEAVDAAGYLARAHAMFAAAGENAEARLRAEKCEEVAKVFRVYEALLLESGAVDFGDLVALPTRLIEENADVRDALSTRHRHIIVDEYQDVNRASVRLLKKLHGGTNRIWVVGDLRQSIYRFRGASSANMGLFTTDFPGADVHSLGINYRSSQQIVDCYTSFAHKMKASAQALPLSLTAKRGKAVEQPEHRLAGMPDDEISTVAGAIDEARARGYRYHDQVVLCTGNGRLAEFAAGLEARDIPILYLGSLFERPEIKDLLSLLSLLDDRYAASLVRAATLPPFPMPLADVQLVIAHLRENKVDHLDWCTVAPNVPNVSELARASLRRLADTMAGFNNATEPWEILTALVLDRLDIAREIAKGTRISAKMRGIAVWQLLQFSRTQPRAKGPPASRFLQRIRRLLQLSDDRELRQIPAQALSLDGVQLMTIHSSKGLEFPVVHLPGLIKTVLPRAHQTPRCPPPDEMIDGAQGMSALDFIKLGHEEEQECLFFVGLSRARDQLVLYSSTRMEGGKNRNPSDYLIPIGPHLAKTLTPRTIAAPSPPSEPVPVIWHEAPILTDHLLGQFERCPRRFFYSHLLKAGGRQTETPFMQMHSALKTVLSRLSTEYPVANPAPEILQALVDETWQESGPTEDPYAADYRRIADRLIKVLIEARTGHTLLPPAPMTLNLGSAIVTVTPHHIISRPDGAIAVRRVRTGAPTSTEFSHLDYTVTLLAAKSAYGPEAIVESLHLTGATIEPGPSLSQKNLTARQDKVVDSIKALRGGAYPRKESDRTCPRCPCLLICGEQLPPGTISSKI